MGALGQPETCTGHRLAACLPPARVEEQFFV